MDINNRTELIKKLKQQIKEKQMYLHERFKELEKEKTNSKNLESVRDDYQKYFNYINTIKQDQLYAFENISRYLDKIGCELQTTDTLLEETRQDQQLVTGEIQKLKRELEKIIE